MTNMKTGGLPTQSLAREQLIRASRTRKEEVPLVPEVKKEKEGQSNYGLYSTRRIEGRENLDARCWDCVCCLSGVGILLSCHGTMLGAGEFSLLCCWEEDF